MANIFPPSSNFLPLKILAGVAVLGGLVHLAAPYYFTPKYTRVGYTPKQPVAFDHALHVDQLGMDCRYCHSAVESSSHASVPTTQTCMNCHRQVGATNAKLAPVRVSWETGRPIEWVRVHQTPDYVFFNHSVHVNRGVSCVSCHGNVNRMTVVRHDQPMSMSWCLDCHRDAGTAVRPVEHVFNLDWKPAEGQRQSELGPRLVGEWNIKPPVDCSGCHR